jgi:hypothetical protein
MMPLSGVKCRPAFWQKWDLCDGRLRNELRWIADIRCFCIACVISGRSTRADTTEMPNLTDSLRKGLVVGQGQATRVFRVGVRSLFPDFRRSACRRRQLTAMQSHSATVLNRNRRPSHPCCLAVRNGVRLYRATTARKEVRRSAMAFASSRRRLKPAQLNPLMALTLKHSATVSFF